MQENQRANPAPDSTAPPNPVDDDLYPPSVPHQFRIPFQAIGELASTLRADEGYDPVTWMQTAETGLWTDLKPNVTLDKWIKDSNFRYACEAAYRRDRPPLAEIVGTIVTALTPCEAHIRDRLCRIDAEEKALRVQQGKTVSLGREVCDGSSLDFSIGSIQPYGLRDYEITKALKYRWPGITETDITAAIEEGLRLEKIKKSKYHARYWKDPEIIYRLMAPKVDEPGETKCFSPVMLTRELDISADTLRKYAKAAGVQIPDRGQKQFEYSLPDALKIANKIAEGATASNRKLAKMFIDRYSRLAKAELKPA